MEEFYTNELTFPPPLLSNFREMDDVFASFPAVMQAESITETTDVPDLGQSCIPISPASDSSHQVNHSDESVVLSDLDPMRLYFTQLSPSINQRTLRKIFPQARHIIVNWNKRNRDYK